MDEDTVEEPIAEIPEKPSTDTPVPSSDEVIRAIDSGAIDDCIPRISMVIDARRTVLQNNYALCPMCGQYLQEAHTHELQSYSGASWSISLTPTRNDSDGSAEI